LSNRFSPLNLAFVFSLNGTVIALFCVQILSELLRAVLRYRMLKLKESHFPLENCGFYEGDPDAIALESGTKAESSFLQSQSGLSGSVQESLTLCEDDNLFGDCVLCRQLISEDRLKQLPWTAYCRACDPSGKEQALCLELSIAA
jgi:RNA polymerase-binding transcription factor DksA